MKNKHYLLRHGRILFLMFALLVASVAMGAFASLNEATSGQTLSAPNVWNWYENGAWQVNFETSQNIGDEEVNVTVHYKLNDGNYQTYNPEAGEVAVAVGTTLSFYASAEGYNDSPVSTVTCTAPFWNSMQELWSDDFYYETETPILLHDDMPVNGFHYMMLDGDLLSEHVLTPEENLGNGFMLSNNGLYSEVERTYAIKGLTAGQVLTLDIVEPEKTDGNGARERAKARLAASRHRIIAYGVTPKVTPVSGLELDQWNSEDNGQDAWHIYTLHVTADGTVRFKVAAKCALRYVSLMSLCAPEMPTFQQTAVSGANRTYRIYNTGTTLHYTTAVAQEMPATTSKYWSSTGNGYVDVTVSGQGYLYAYSENSVGNGAIASQYVNGVALALNPPIISSKSYDTTTGLWTVTLSADESSIEGRPKAAIYYKIGNGEAIPYSEAFTIGDGVTFSTWATADGYDNSPVITMTAEQGPTLDYVWNEYYSYYSAAVVTKGEEMEPGLFQILYNGNPIGSGHLLTPDENFNDNFMVVRYNRGLTSAETRTYAYSGLTAGQMLYIIYSNGIITPVQGLEIDAWNSTNIEAHLRVTADGIVKFTLSPGAYLLSASLYNERQEGDVVVSDVNGNQLSYHYETAEGDATLTAISSYADDEEKAGHIVIADEVTDRKGNTHKVTAIGSSLSNRSGIKSIVFGQNVTTLGSNCLSSTAITELTIPATIVEMNDNCFRNNDQLLTVDFDADAVITALPQYCFYECNNLQTVTLPNSIQTIGNYAFEYCNSLRNITFGTGLIADAFGTNYYLFYNCENMESMTLPGINIPFAANYYSLPTSLILYVNADMVDAYKANEYTKKFHIMAIGANAGFAVTTNAGGQIATELAKLTDTTADVLSLSVTGPINGTDINYIHQAMPYLQTLNLRNAQIVEGGDQYARWNVNGGVVTQSGSTTYSTRNDSVGPYMFSNMQQLKQLILPQGVTGIGAYSVYQSNKLTTVELPGALNTIGENAFYMSTTYNQLSQIDIPNQVTTIGKNAFSYAALTSVTIPEGVTRIEQSVFNSCEHLKTVILPNNVSYIGAQAFAYCQELESVNMPSKVETIDNEAFYYCNKLASAITIPATCLTIGNYAFYQCRAIPSVTFNEGLTSIGNSAFYQCSTLETIDLPSTVATLGSNVFAYNEALTTFTFPSAIKEIPEGVLRNCSHLESVNLANGTTKIGRLAFYYCPLLTSINLSQPTLTTIGYEAFYNTGLTNVILTDNITSIDTYAFSNCSQLESINVPASLTNVPEGYCQYCTKLATVTMHDGLRNIGNYAFTSCTALEAIDLNDAITEIGYNAFSDCQQLVLTKLPASLKTIHSSAFYNTKAFSELTLPAGLTTLERYAFQSSGLTSIVIPEGITTYGSSIFYDCDKLTSVTLPSDITTLPSSMFYGTTALQSIQLPQALENINSMAFYSSGLTDIQLPPSLKTIGSQAFYNTQLSQITIPKTVTSVGSQFAAYCTKLKKAALGRKMDYTQNSYFDYFQGCTNLDSLRIYAGMPPGSSNNYYNYTSAYRKNCVLEVPMDVVDTYKETDVWNTFKSIIGFEVGDELRDADFAVMKKLYQQLNGANWAKPWNLTTNTHSAGKWQGVTTKALADDEETFAITAIDLSGQGLTGPLPKEVFLMDSLRTLNLSHNAIEARVDTLLDSENNLITTVNLEGNHLRGDLYPFVSKLPELTSLNVSYNWLTAYSQTTNNTKLTNYNMRRGYQFVDYTTMQPSVPDDLMDEVVIDFTPGVPISIESNTLQTYRHEASDYNFTFSNLYRLYDGGGYLATSGTELTKADDLWDVYPGNILQAPKGQLVAYTHGQPYYSYITYIFRMDWKDGDVNADQTVDVTDLQNVIYYALNGQKPGNSMYNYTAADANGDKKINVSDIVGCVNFIMAYNEDAAGSRVRSTNMLNDSRNSLVLHSNSVMLANADEVAALQLTINGVNKYQVSVAQELRTRFTVDIREMEDGVKLVIYSPVGNTLAPGEHKLLETLPAGATVSDVRLADSEAHRLGVNIEGTTTAIDFITIPSQYAGQVYDLQGRRVGQWPTLPSGIYIINVNGKQYKVKK